MITNDFPKTELEFHERFATEEACREYLSAVRWPDGFVCPKCGHKGGWRRSNRDQWICSAKGCRKETSLRSGTVLHNSRKPLREWMLTMFLLVTNKQSISALRLRRLLKHGSYHTSTRWLREMRRAMGVSLSKRDQLGPIVEIDETYIGGKDVGGKRGHGSAKKVTVVGAVEAVGGRCGRARFQVIAKRTDQEVGAFVAKVVAKGSVVKSDWVSAYLNLPDDFHVDARVVSDTPAEAEEYRAKRGRKEKGAKKKVQEHLPNFHRVASLVKRVLISAHQGACGRHLQLYLDEYCFRFDGRNRERLFGLVDDLGHAAVRTQCVPYWRSCGRKSPHEPTYKQSRAFRVFELGGGARG